MHTISRIYIGNYGWNSAWYDGIVFDFRDRVSNTPTDAIITLENGGGKTTLLSAIFSCFDTKKDRFLKTLHDARNKMSEYFSSDGTPAFILVEWQRTDPVSKKEISFVTGQCVAVKSAIDRNELERHFFSFQCNDDLTMEAVPAPKLSKEYAHNLQDVQTWLHNMRTAYKGNFFETKNQADWERHLEAERGIDVHLLKLQVDFSKQEGGIDAAFLTFKNEQEFLRKFFQLTINERRAEDVRQTVASACDKLERKPFFQDRLKALLLVQEKLLAFAADAREVVTVKRSLRELHGDLRTAYFTAVYTADASLASMQEKQRESELHAIEADHLTSQQNEYRARWVDLENLVRYRTWTTAREKKQEAEVSLKQLRRELKLLDAAKAQSAIDQSEEEIARLNKQTENARKGLQTFENDARFNGSILRAALERTKLELQNTAATFGRNITEESELREERRKTISECIDVESRKSAELEVLRQRQASFEQDVQTFVEKGWLQHVEEQPSSALAYLQRLAEEQVDEAARCKTSLDDFERESRATAARLDHLRKTEASIARKLDEQIEFLRDCDDEREKLLHDRLLCEILVADVADPDHPDATHEVEQDARKTQSSIERCSVQASELEREEMSVAQTGLAGRMDDVEAVLDCLAARGVTSAMAFNKYLARIEPDGQRAGQILASNPAKYLGVAIQKMSELPLATEILQKPPELMKPVWVTLISEKSDPIEDGFVVLPHDNSLVNFGDAQTFAEGIAVQRRTIESTKGSLKDRLSACNELLSSLKQYIKVYGASARKNAEANSVNLSAELGDVRSQIRAEEEGLSELTRKIDDVREKERLASNRVIELRHQIEQIQDFQRRYGDTTERKRLIESLAAEVVELTTARQRLTVEMQQQEEKMTRLRLEQRELERAAVRTEEELQSILHVDVSVDAEQHLRLNPKSTDVLRRLYWQAKDLLDREQRGRLGHIQERLELMEAQLIQQRKDFLKAFAGVDQLAIKPYLNCDFEIERSRNEREIEDCQISLQARAADEAIAKSAHTDFLAANPSAKDISQEFANIETDCLRERVLEFRELEDKAREGATSSQRAAVIAKQLANELKGKHKAAENICNQLRVMVPNELPCEPDQQLLDDIDDLTETATRLINSHTKLNQAMSAAERAAQRTHALLLNEVRSGLATLEADVAHDLLKNELEVMCENTERLQTLLSDRIETLQDMLKALTADFELAVAELQALVLDGIDMLTRACKKCVPEGVRYVGAKPVLRMTSTISSVPAETRRQAISDYLDEIIRSGRPAKLGTDLVADAIQRLSGKPLGIKFLKMTIDPKEQYAAVDRISNSGGEGVVMAMFLYCVIAQLRGEMQADTRKAGGGPLILDNPFAKATTPTLWTGQRLLAKEMGVQLLFATALSDYNTLAEFEHIFRLRKAGQNTKTGRFHIELVDYQLIKNG